MFAFQPTVDHSPLFRLVLYMFLLSDLVWCLLFVHINGFQSWLCMRIICKNLKKKKTPKSHKAPMSHLELLNQKSWGGKVYKYVFKNLCRWLIKQQDWESLRALQKWKHIFVMPVFITVPGIIIKPLIKMSNE